MNDIKNLKQEIVKMEKDLRNLAETKEHLEKERKLIIANKDFLEEEIDSKKKEILYYSLREAKFRELSKKAGEKQSYVILFIIKLYFKNRI